jgi:hypothetical protein
VLCDTTVYTVRDALPRGSQPGTCAVPHALTVYCCVYCCVPQGEGDAMKIFNNVSEYNTEGTVQSDRRAHVGRLFLTAAQRQLGTQPCMHGGGLAGTLQHSPVHASAAGGGAC